jgi:hypothetical protein
MIKSALRNVTTICRYIYKPIHHDGMSCLADQIKPSIKLYRTLVWYGMIWYGMVWV